MSRSFDFLKRSSTQFNKLFIIHFLIGHYTLLYYKKIIQSQVSWALIFKKTLKNKSGVISTSTEPNIFTMLFSIKSQKNMML
jgi:hypothetical protein